MSLVNRTPIVHENFLEFLEEQSVSTCDRDRRSESASDQLELSWQDFYRQFRCMCASRQLDRMARKLKSDGEGFYTIASSGHESNVSVSYVLRGSDPGMVHYRSGAFMFWRLLQRKGELPLKDMLRSLVASKHDPVSGGRHKVFGDHNSWILPQTSTIASHLPRAIGLAFGLERMNHLDLSPPVPEDSIILCSFGDASVNHSVFQGALNAALWAAHQQLPVPLLLLCEDNGLGISVRTPENWIETSIRSREHIEYYSCDGTDPLDVLETSKEAVQHCRTFRKPVFLHLDTVRLLGHAGSDVELEYRSVSEIEADEEKDPLKQYAGTLLESGTYTANELRETYESIGARMSELVPEVLEEPRLSSSEEVMTPIETSYKDLESVVTEARYQTRDTAGPGSDSEQNREEESKSRTMAQLLNREFEKLMNRYPELCVFGEDVAEKGGVYYVTRDLYKKAGRGRVFNTILDETTILGIGLGMSSLGMLPFPEIQYLAYLYNAYDQLRGEAGAQPFYSNGMVENPMVVRLPSFGYQEGIGGHFHNDNGIAAIREIPGIIIAVPSRGDDAARMLRTATALAKSRGKIVVFLEPIALYHRKDLFEEDDRKWMFEPPADESAATPGEPRIYYGDRSNDLTILTYGNGTYYSLQAARVLREEHDRSAMIVDLRWLKPLNTSVLERVSRTAQPILVVDEGRRTGSPSEEICSYILEEVDNPPDVRRLTADDCYVPIGPAADEILPTTEDIVESALKMLR